MPAIDPAEYLKRVTDDRYDEDVAPLDSQQINQDAEMVMQSGVNDPRASEYSGFESDALNYSKGLFDDDTMEGIMKFLRKAKVTTAVKAKFLEVYNIAASQDNVLTWSNAYLLRRRADMFKLQMLEFKNTLIGADSDSLLFGDFDLTVEIFVSRLEARNGRSFEGFERRAGVSNYQYAVNMDGTAVGQTLREERSGLGKLGSKINMFKGQ